MLNSNNSRRQVQVLLLVLIFVNAVFLLWTPLLPFIDLPNHLAESTIFKYHEGPDNLFSEYYQPAPWYFPNSFHTVFCSFFPDVELGNKIFHIGYIMLLYAAVSILINHLKGNPWYGMLAVLCTYNYNVTFGFVGFAVSIPMLLFLFYLTLLDIEKDKWVLKAAISALLILIYLMHAQNALLGLLIYGALILYHYKSSIGKILVNGLLVGFPLVAFMLVWWFTRDGENESSTFSYLFDYYRSDYFENLYIRAGLFVFDNFQLQAGTPGLIIATIFFACILTPIFWLRPWLEKPIRVFIPQAFYAFLFFMIIFLCYLFLPDRLPGQTPLFQRLCTLVILAFIILGSMWLSDVRTKALKYFVIATCVAYTGMWFEYIQSFNRQNKRFNKEFFAGISNESKLAGLIYDNNFRGRKVYIHFPNYFIVWNKGIAATRIIDYRFGVVRRAATASSLPFYHDYIGDYYKPVPQYSGMDYLLVRGMAPVIPDENLSGFALIRQKGVWQLYRRPE